MITTLFVAFLASPASAALDVDLTSSASIKAAAKLKAADLMTFYHGNEAGQIPGILPGPPPQGPYYWWQGGAMWGTLVDYWHYTGDPMYNDIVQQSLVFQVGPDRNYMDPNWTASLGNDDQAFWAMSTLLAAENNFQNPPSKDPQWLALAQAVFNTQASPQRHDTECGNGLRWQIPQINVGWDYKNAIANGCFFNLGARLARYTGNQTYADWAAKTWDWMASVGIIDAQWNVFDGVHVPKCDLNTQQFSYNVAILLQGSAFMYDYTGGDQLWRTRVEGLLGNLLHLFFPSGTAIEFSCELPDKLTCTTDMLSFKGYLHRWMAVTAQLAPFVAPQIRAVLKSSAAAAVSTCTGGANGRTCGFRWVTGAYDGTEGAGQEMSVLGALTSLLMDEAAGPLTKDTGGTSPGDPSAGGDASAFKALRPITQADRAGAGILTFLGLAVSVGTMAWMSSKMQE